MPSIAHPAAQAGAPLHAQQLTDALRKRLETCRAHFGFFFGGTVEALEADDGRLEFVASIGVCTRRFRSVPEIEGFIAALDEHEAPRGELARFLGAQVVNA